MTRAPTAATPELVRCKRRGRWLVALGATLALCFASARATSQPRSPEGERAIAFHEALAIARRDPPVVLAALARALAADAQIDVARSALQPTVAATVIGTAAVMQTDVLYSTSPIPAGLIFPGIVPTAALEGTIAMRWPLWDFGRTDLAVAAAGEGVRAATEDIRSAERIAMTEVARAYYLVLADEELVAQAKETLRQRARQAEISAGLVRNGTRAEIEATRSEVALDVARGDLTLAEGRRDVDMATLASALALDPTVRLRLSAPERRAVDEDPARAADLALATRPELAAARARVMRAEKGLAAARAGWRPLLSANAVVGERYANHVLSDALTEQGSAQVALSVPIVDPVIRANTKIAEADLDAAHAALAKEGLAVRTEAVQAAIRVRAARAALAQAERVAAGAASTLALAQTRYESGSTPLLELLDAQASDAGARVGRVRSRYELDLAIAQLFASSGRVDELARGD